MACKLTNLKPPCGYNPSGISMVGLLDFDDFGGAMFADDGGYQSAYIEALYKASPVVAVPNDVARYTSTTSGLLHEHRLELFVPSLSAAVVSQLNLALRRRFVVLFKTEAGTFHAFGVKNGAKLSFAALTDDGTGATVTLVERSVYPLFEVAPDTFAPDDWILRTGAWDMLGRWYLFETWKTI